MARFSASSLAQLSTVHPDLRRVFTAVVKDWDCTILEGERTEAQQVLNVQRGASHTVASKHLRQYSRYPVGVDAVDVAPYPLHWPQPALDGSPAERERAQKDVARLYYFAGYVLGVAWSLGIKLRHGGDWDGDHDIHDQSFDDLPHFELMP